MAMCDQGLTAAASLVLACFGAMLGTAREGTHVTCSSSSFVDYWFGDEFACHPPVLNRSSADVLCAAGYGCTCMIVRGRGIGLIETF